ncbi:MAG: GNAT family N-acetyltransferase [Planctomycetota bacterium]
MFKLRRFHNTDPPHLAEIWRSQPPQRGLMQPMSAGLLEHCVFSRQYFDPEGLIVATRDETPVGFAHAGFGPHDDGAQLDRDLGATQLVMLRTDGSYPRLADELLRASEQYLRSRGAKVLYGGGISPINPFYLGLYGGSELPGVLDSDTGQRELFLRNNYADTGRVVVLQRELARFRTFMSRTQRQLRRELLVEYDPAPTPPDWFEACQFAGTDQVDFTLTRRRDSAVLASVRFWDIEPLASSWGIRTAGMHDLYVEPGFRREGLGSYLLAEAFKEVQRRGIAMIEAHTMADNEAALAFYKKLGFTQVDGGTVLRRQA